VSGIDWSSENLRYLLWADHPERERWPAIIRSWLGLDESRIVAILLGDPLSHAELQLLAETVGRAQEELQFSRLAPQERAPSVLRENLRYLVETAGEKRKDIAAAIGVHRTTIPDWLRGEGEPTPAHTAKICRHFALSPDIDLETDPIFLSWLPVSDAQRRAWMVRQIGQIRPETLRDLFPALERLLRSP
jgi:transcriptional regulator with XRE-family HTH domain